ncbi:CLUMA_CG015368, isoform A [Clunio marinus]|uniref:Phospholipase B1, membrane-associated n=1 Tax=Clunio marinus TaxID=568069 RepID=A0A1J1IPZ1_9DIPT|nr:CLUMA_CG015368, isoform A [Clunio marinus]
MSEVIKFQYKNYRTLFFTLIKNQIPSEAHKINLKLGRLQPQLTQNESFFCDTTTIPKKSKNIPQSVHELRPGDIDIVGAIGDSLTAGNGGMATNIFQVTIESKGVSFSIGGEKTWREYLTIPNILKEFNPNVYGYSVGDGLTIFKSSKFNAAELGAMSRDTPYMARVLINRIKTDPNVKPYHWKLITFLIGSNDFCLDFCHRQHPEEKVNEHERDLLNVFRTIRDNLNRTMLNVVLPPNMKVLVNFKGKPEQCEFMHKFECPCYFGSNRKKNHEKYFKIAEEWNKRVIEVANRDEFHDRKDFTINVQPFVRNFVFPTLSNGLHDFTYMSMDCFHLSQKGYAMAFSTLVTKRQEPTEVKSHKFSLSTPVYDEKFLLDEKNIENINENIKLRKGVGDIFKVHELRNNLKCQNLSHEENIKLNLQLQEEFKRIPNNTHPDVKHYGDHPKVIGYYNKKPEFNHKPLDFADICKAFNILRTEHMGNFSGSKSYILMKELAELEQALIRYTLEEILKHGFRLMSVPDILPSEVIKSCGMTTDGERNQVYRLLPSNLCLSGTSEMALAGYFAGNKLKEKELPVKVAAVSRCFRAESSSVLEERGIFRVHQFTKVEMFSVCRPSESPLILDEFKEIEINLFKNIGIHFQLLDMPPSELGAPAYRKYDIEAWMPGRNMWGEISSCSNCTDYQSRRLNIKVEESDEFAHTVNGTACAIPRMLIAIIESFQHEDGTVLIPKVLQKYMRCEKIMKNKTLPKLKLIKSLTSEKS